MRDKVEEEDNGIDRMQGCRSEDRVLTPISLIPLNRKRECDPIHSRARHVLPPAFCDDLEVPIRLFFLVFQVLFNFFQIQHRDKDFAI